MCEERSCKLRCEECFAYHTYYNVRTIDGRSLIHFDCRTQQRRGRAILLCACICVYYVVHIILHVLASLQFVAWEVLNADTKREVHVGGVYLFAGWVPNWCRTVQQQTKLLVVETVYSSVCLLWALTGLPTRSNGRPFGFILGYVCEIHYMFKQNVTPARYQGMHYTRYSPVWRLSAHTYLPTRSNGRPCGLILGYVCEIHYMVKQTRSRYESYAGRGTYGTWCTPVM